MLKTFKDSPVMTFGASEQDTFYLLNPADNLGKTEEMFKSRFENEKRWAGVVGRKPEPEELANALQSKEVYIFFGHGAGTSYYRTMPDNLEGLTVNTAALVIGCSSGRLTADGSSLESYGTPYRFLVNGAPCYVGVLWDVTDRDIDKFSDRMLENWLPSWQKEKGSKSIAYSCTEARSACKLKYLIGAAPVVYGLPVHAFSKNSTK
ncbi:Separin [Halotydeus destructor]|nr:Separin [Halotydeus destructor]